MDENQRKLAQALEEKKKKKPEQSESLYSSLAKKGWLGTKAKITVEADEERAKQGK